MGTGGLEEQNFKNGVWNRRSVGMGRGQNQTGQVWTGRETTVSDRVSRLGLARTSLVLKERCVSSSASLVALFYFLPSPGGGAGGGT